MFVCLCVCERVSWCVRYVCANAQQRRSCWPRKERKKGKKGKKGSAFASSRRSLGSFPNPSLVLSSLLSPSLPLLTLLAKSYLKPEYLSLGFFQSVTFSSTAATTCEVVRRFPIEVFDVDVVGLGGDSLAVAAERPVVATEAVEVIDVDLREEDAMLLAK